MNYSILAVATLSFVISNIGMKKSKSSTLNEKLFNIAAFNFIIASAMWIVFFIGNSKFSPIALIFATLWAVGSIICFTSFFTALKCGSLSKTQFFNSASLLIPILCGVLVWNEPFGINKIFGLLTMLGAFYLITYSTDKRATKLNKKWLFHALVVFISNGLISFVVKYQQIEFPEVSAELMTACCFTIAALIAFILNIILNIKKKSSAFAGINILNKEKLSISLIALGIGLGNLTVAFLSSKIQGALLFPVVLGGSLIITILISIRFFNEKATKTTILGMFLCVISIILLAI